MESDLFGSLLLQTPTLAVFVMALTEALGKGVKHLRPVPQETLALILGPVAGMAGHWFGWIGVGDAVGVKGYVAAGAVGLASTVIAGLAHDKVLNAVLPGRVATAYNKAKMDDK